MSKSGYKNILLINHYAGSPDMGMEFRPYYLAKEWVSKGYAVDIIAADYSHLRSKNPKILHDFETQKIGGIHYHWIHTKAYTGNGLNRALTMLQFVGKLWKNAKKIAQEYNPDVIITSSTYPLDTYAGQRIKKFCKRKTKLIHEVHDMWPSTLIELGGMSKWNPFVMMMQLAENSAYKHSDFVVSLPPCAEAYMKNHGLDDGKFVNIRNGIVLSEWECYENIPEEYREKLLKLKEENFIVGYFGGHALSNALDILIRAAKILQNEHIQIVLVGDGVEKEQLIKQVEVESINNVTFFSTISKSMIPDLVSYFDCCYIGGKDSPLYRFGICMNKLFDSMMSGKPIICAIDTPDTIVENVKCGIMAKGGSAMSVAEAIVKVRDLSEVERREMGERGKKEVVGKYNYSFLAERFADLFKVQ